MLFCLIIYWHVNLQTKNMKFIIKYVKIKYKKSKLVLKKLNGLSTQDNIYYGMAVLWIWNNSFWIRIQLRLLNQLKRRITQRQLPSKGTFHCIFCKIKQKRIIFLLIFVWNRIGTINSGSGFKTGAEKSPQQCLRKEWKLPARPWCPPPRPALPHTTTSSDQL